MGIYIMTILSETKKNFSAKRDNVKTFDLTVKSQKRLFFLFLFRHTTHTRFKQIII